MERGGKSIKNVFEPMHKKGLSQIQKELDSYQDISVSESSTKNELATINKAFQDVEEFEDISNQDEYSVNLVESTKKICQEIDEYEDISNDQDDSKDMLVKVIKIRQKSSGYKDISEGSMTPIKDQLGLDGKFEVLKGGALVPYEFANEILKRNHIRYFDSPSTGKLHKFNGMIWEPLCGSEDLEQIVYHEMKEDERREQENIQGFCKKVVKFILYECKDRYENGERFGKPANKKSS